MVKVLPTPSVLSHVTSPFIRSIMALTMERPRPLPVEESGVREDETVYVLLNMWGMA